ncbi:MAG: hypothetical protein ACTSXJ_08420 [Candidatus Baldrarchaeia archaeon]
MEGLGYRVRSLIIKCIKGNISREEFKSEFRKLVMETKKAETNKAFIFQKICSAALSLCSYDESLRNVIFDLLRDVDEEIAEYCRQWSDWVESIGKRGAKRAEELLKRLNLR